MLSLEQGSLKDSEDGNMVRCAYLPKSKGSSWFSKLFILAFVVMVLFAAGASRSTSRFPGKKFLDAFFGNSGAQSSSMYSR